jgi:O-antigen/teichoic acid export membrane protein
MVNFVATAVLIQFFNGEGAAAAYLFTILLQAVLFFKYSDIPWFGENILGFILPLIYAITGCALANWLFTDTWLILLASLFVYFTCLVLTKQLRRDDWRLIVEQSRS